MGFVGEGLGGDYAAYRPQTRPLRLIGAGEAAVREPYQDETGRFMARAQRKRRVVTTLLVSDSVLLLIASLLVTFVRYDHFHVVVESQFRDLTPLRLAQSLIVVACLLLAMQVSRLYDIDRLGWGSGELVRTAQALAMGILAVVSVSFLMGVPGVEREWAILTWLVSTALIVSSRVVLRRAATWSLKRDDWLQRPTLIIGSNNEAAAVARTLRSNPTSGLTPVGYLTTSRKDRQSFDFCPSDLPALGAARDIVSVVTERQIDSVVIIASAFDYDVLRRMIKDVRDVHVSVHVSSGLSDVLSSRVLLRAIGGMPLMSVAGVSHSDLNLVAKRAFDLVAGGFIILAGLPLWATIAALIKATSEGPVFYQQERVGKDGRPFQMYKFRTMCADADQRLEDLADSNEADGPLFKMRDDPRVTAVGKWLRRFSFDEFPQLLNVMKGEMSLVGPRPPVQCETAEYAEKDWRRLEVPPGMTGLWQVSGRSNLSFHEMVRLDVFYIDNWSVTFDLALMARTLPVMISARGAY